MIFEKAQNLNNNHTCGILINKSGTYLEKGEVNTNYGVIFLVDDDIENNYGNDRKGGTLF